MRIDLSFTPSTVDELALRDRAVVVIDVLRASTSIVTALSNGAKEIIPATTVESATKISSNLGGNVAFLAGERGGRMIPGFDLGNSPFEYSEGKVRGRSIIFTSTNGSQALVRARFAQELVVCAFINMSTVVGFLAGRSRDVTIVCSGRDGGFSLEDGVCAGMLISRIVDASEETPVLSDSAVAAMTLYRAFGRGIFKMLKNSDHGRYLQEIGFGEDLKYCAQVDTVPVLPILTGGVLKLLRVEERKEQLPQPQNP